MDTNTHIYIYTRIFGPRFARPQFLARIGAVQHITRKYYQQQPRATTRRRCWFGPHSACRLHPWGEGASGDPPHTNTNNDQNPFSTSQHHNFDTLGLSSGFFTFLNTGSLCRRMSAPINGFPFFCTATCPQKLVIFSSLKDSGSSCGAHFFVVQDIRFIVFSLCISSPCLSYLNVGQAQSKNYWLVWKMEHPRRRQSALRELVAALSKLPVHSKTWACPK